MIYRSADAFLDHYPAQTERILDVRSPSEYRHGHIPTALSFPLFDDEERKIVGTLYKQRGREAALIEGVSLVAPKMRKWLEHALEWKRYPNIWMYCWRGGLRSQSMAWLLSLLDLPIVVVEGGYKAIRAAMARRLDTMPLQIIVLGGKTGSGKTQLLHHLQELGEQVLDLEALARHRGSAFGHLLLPDQPSGEQFFNEIYFALAQMDLTKPIWVEAESRQIGKLPIPEALWHKMQVAPRIDLEVPRNHRVRMLVDEYAKAAVADLLTAFDKIRKRLGDLHYRQAVEALRRGDYHRAAHIALHYYDKTYTYARQHAPNPVKKLLEVNSFPSPQIAARLKSIGYSLLSRQPIKQIRTHSENASTGWDQPMYSKKTNS